ncbi:hypothetical protein Micbo1qcDRAFT_172649 [Microdochium bolleyi]|uniref:RRM domain-containing protein n=1 Tax=Microdochium bolleyi TaxID=196109 RepID=A0A136J9I4_9PEZI|nr:hypothetical protein Micbo1qcDRAFT_172649 [Microdochium bolleyi]
MALTTWRHVADQAARSAGPPPHPDQYGFRHYYEAEPPVRFFKDVPAGARAVFSTENGKRPLRPVASPDIKRNCYAWPADQIAWLCNNIRTNFPAESKYLQPVRSYCDLYNYWDAYDIYHYGAQNLNNVVNRMRHENLTYLPALAEGARPEFERWVDSLLHTDQRFATRLKAWNDQNSPDIMSILDSKHKADHEDLKRFYLTVLRGVLWERHQALRSRPPTPTSVDLRSKTASTSSRSGCSSAAEADLQVRTPCGDLVVDGTSATAARRRRLGCHAENSDGPASGLMQRLALPTIAPHHVQLGLTPAAAALLPFTFKVFPPPQDSDGFPLASAMPPHMPVAPHHTPFPEPACSQAPISCYRQSSAYAGNPVQPMSQTWQGHPDTRSATTTWATMPHRPNHHSQATHIHYGGHHARSTPPRQVQANSKPLHARYPSNIIPPYPSQAIPPLTTSSSAGPRPLPQPPAVPYGRKHSVNRDTSRNLNSAQGKWQTIGKDDLHGVKHTFTKNRAGSSFSGRSHIHARNVSGNGAVHNSILGYRNEASRRVSTQHLHNAGTRNGDFQDDVFTQSTKNTTLNHKKDFNLYTECLNSKKDWQTMQFEPCPCSRCQAMSRSIFVTFSFRSHGIRSHPRFIPEFAHDASEKLRTIFSSFGPIEGIQVWPTRSSATIRFAAEGANHVAIKEAHDKHQPLFDWYLMPNGLTKDLPESTDAKQDKRLAEKPFQLTYLVSDSYWPRGQPRAETASALPLDAAVKEVSSGAISSNQETSASPKQSSRRTDSAASPSQRSDSSSTVLSSTTLTGNGGSKSNSAKNKNKGKKTKAALTPHATLHTKQATSTKNSSISGALSVDNQGSPLRAVRHNWRRSGAHQPPTISSQNNFRGEQNFHQHQDKGRNKSFGKLRVSKQRHQNDPEYRTPLKNQSGSNGAGSSYSSEVPPDFQAQAGSVASNAAGPKTRKRSESSLRSQVIDESPRFFPHAPQDFDDGICDVEPWPVYQDQMALIDSCNVVNQNNNNSQRPRGISNTSSSGFWGPRTSQTSSVAFCGRTPAPSRASMSASRAAYMRQSPSVIRPGHFNTAPKALNPLAADFVSPTRTPALSGLSVTAEEANAGESRLPTIGGLDGCMSAPGSPQSGSSPAIMTPTGDATSEVADETVMGLDPVQTSNNTVPHGAAGDWQATVLKLFGTIDEKDIANDIHEVCKDTDAKFVSADATGAAAVQLSEEIKAQEVAQLPKKKMKKKSAKKKQAANLADGVQSQGSPGKKVTTKAKFNNKSEGSSSRPHSRASGERPANNEFFKSKCFQHNGGSNVPWRKNNDNGKHQHTDDGVGKPAELSKDNNNNSSSNGHGKAYTNDTNSGARDAEDKHNKPAASHMTLPRGHAHSANPYASYKANKTKARPSIPEMLRQKKSCPDFTAPNGTGAPSFPSPRGKPHRGNNMTSSAAENNAGQKPATSPKMQLSAMDWPELPTSSPSMKMKGTTGVTPGPTSGGHGLDKTKTSTEEVPDKSTAASVDSVGGGSVWKRKSPIKDVPVTESVSLTGWL